MTWSEYIRLERGDMVKIGPKATYEGELAKVVYTQSFGQHQAEVCVKIANVNVPQRYSYRTLQIIEEENVI